VGHWILHWLLSGLGLYIVTRIVPGIQVDGFGSALIAALAIGIVNATLGLALKFLAFPFIFLTLGLATFLINGLMLKVSSELVPGFRVDGCGTAVLGSILLTVVDYALFKLI
jgi:putative membrane protein